MTTIGNLSKSRINITNGEHAHIEGNYAKEQGNYAKEQGNYAKEQGVKGSELNNQLQNSENDRSLEFERLKTASETATSNANEATSNANMSASNANMSASSAESASQLAYIAAGNAEVARDCANDAASNASAALALMQNNSYKGAWTHSTEYKKSNTVYQDGTFYISKFDNTSKSPKDNLDLWDVVCSGFNWRGIYVSGETYYPNDIVINETKTTIYICVNKNNGVLTDVSNFAIYTESYNDAELRNTLDLKANSSDVYTKTESDINYLKSTNILQGTNMRITKDGNNITFNSLGGGSSDNPPNLIHIFCDGINDHLKIQEAIDSITDTNIPTTIMPIGNCVINGAGATTSLIKLKPNMTLDGQFCKMVFDCEATGVDIFNQYIIEGSNTASVKNLDIEASNISCSIECLMSLQGKSNIINCRIRNFNTSPMANVGFIYLGESYIKDCIFENVNNTTTFDPIIYCGVGTVEHCSFNNMNGDGSHYIIKCVKALIENNTFTSINNTSIIQATSSQIINNCANGIYLNTDRVFTMFDTTDSITTYNELQDVKLDDLATTMQGFRQVSGVCDGNIVKDVYLTGNGQSASVTGFRIQDENTKFTNNMFDNKEYPNVNLEIPGSNLALKPFLALPSVKRSLISGNTAIYSIYGGEYYAEDKPFELKGTNCIVENNFTNFITIGVISGEGTITKDNIATGEVKPNV